MGMERYRAIVRLEEIRSHMEQGEYDAAKVVADSIRRERLKDSADLFLLASVYRKCGEYETAKDFLLRIYEKKVTWRVLEELMEVCLAEKNPEEAEGYLKQYSKLSGGDPRNYIYEYRIGRQKHRPEEELLPILQTLKAEEYSEKYAYELAKLYHKMGREQECMAECRDLILWFGEGTYVERAKALQAYYRGELSAEDIRMEAERRVREAEERRAKEEEEQRRLAEEQSRLEAEEYAKAEELRRMEEEERLALEAMCRSMAEEHFAVEGMTEDWDESSNRWEEAGDEDAENARDSYFAAEEPDQIYTSVAEDVLEEVAATELYEPMWEEDSTVSMEVALSEAFADEESAEEASESEDYEQMSLFVAAEDDRTVEIQGELKPEAMEVELSEEIEPEYDSEPEEAELEKENEDDVRDAVSPLGKELSLRLAERGLVFEDILHEYARIERVRKQLLRMLEVVVTVRKKCHCLIITGEYKSGKTTLGTYLAKLLYELSYVRSPRVAKISGQRLNGMNLYEKQAQLKDVCLIVESAGEMTEETTEGLLDFIEHAGVLGTVILEDNANAMSRLLRNHAECNRMFNNRVHLPKYDSNELMGFALEYVEQQDYVITAEAKRFLAQQIEYITRTEQKDGRLVATMELVKTALENADYRNQGTILAMASAGNFQAAEALELTVEDFGIIQ
ncbi:MAG: hypothetical protein IJZ55_06700 [Lachnospiraceae bacterium]|nr:hypothetical protein [Lachnospiraceae bacterium]